jgi:hypothetical protein
MNVLSYLLILIYFNAMLVGEHFGSTEDLV